MKSEKSYRASDLEVKTAADKLAKLQNRTLTNLIETLLRENRAARLSGQIVVCLGIFGQRRMLYFSKNSLHLWTSNRSEPVFSAGFAVAIISR
jgi:hypothetical protein